MAEDACQEDEAWNKSFAQLRLECLLEREPGVRSAILGLPNMERELGVCSALATSLIATHHAEGRRASCMRRGRRASCMRRGIGADERHDGVALRWASSAARRAWDAGSKERLSDSTRTACLRPAF